MECSQTREIACTSPKVSLACQRRYRFSIRDCEARSHTFGVSLREKRARMRTESPLVSRSGQSKKRITFGEALAKPERSGPSKTFEETCQKGYALRSLYHREGKLDAIRLASRFLLFSALIFLFDRREKMVFGRLCLLASPKVSRCARSGHHLW